MKTKKLKVTVNKCGKGGGCVITLLPTLIQKEKLEDYKKAA